MLGINFKCGGEVRTVIKVKRPQRPPQSTINCSKLLPAEFTVRTSTKLRCCFLFWDLTPWQQELPTAGIQQLTFQAFGTPAVLDGIPHISPGQYPQANCLQANVCIILIEEISYHSLLVPKYDNLNSLD